MRRLQNIGRANHPLRILQVAVLLSAAFLCNISIAADAYQTPEAFIAQAFPGKIPEPGIIWLTGKRKEAVKNILGHRYPFLRVRYWRQHERSVWILEETGKEQPITAGLIVNRGRLEQIKVLIYRESRGWEVRYPFFTDQFKDARPGEINNLDRHIDGISGATLSVRAMKKLAALALYLNTELERTEHVSPSP
ncbi:MAG: FMN-binding protein [Mariprofundaceae bacterium]|nr:FMN-binding protein [Mariprofundaceae bacterium]